MPVATNQIDHSLNKLTRRLGVSFYCKSTVELKSLYIYNEIYIYIYIYMHIYV